MRYSEICQCEIRGDDHCPFWLADGGGVCKGWSGKEASPCPADEDGSGCPLFEEIISHIQVQKNTVK